MAFNRTRALALGAILAISPLAVGPTTILAVASAATPKEQAAKLIADAVKTTIQSAAFQAAVAEGQAAQAAFNALPANATPEQKAAAQAKIDAAKAKQNNLLAIAVAGAIKAAIRAGIAPGEVSAALAEASANGGVPGNVAIAAANLANATASTNGNGAPSLVNPPTAPGGNTFAAPFDPCAGVIASYCG